MGKDQQEVEIIDTPMGEAGPAEELIGIEKGGRTLVSLGILALVVVVLGWSLVFGDEDERAIPEQPGIEQQRGSDAGPGPIAETSDRLDAVRVAQSIPRPLLIAELFSSEPTAAGLRDLFQAVGGFEGLALASPEGAFDLVRFDPLDHNRLLASHRLSYGDAQNQDINELWTVIDDGVEQGLWNPSETHDFVHFNIDGTTTMWVHGGGDGFAPRTAVIISDKDAMSAPTQPMYSSRSTVANGTVFALTGTGDYYSADTEYVDLIAATGSETTVLAEGPRFGWIDNPTASLLVAYSSSPTGLTAVWDVDSLEPLTTHALAARPYRRVAISGDERVAIGVTSGGALEVLDLESGRFVERFGSVDIEGVDRPVTLNHDGTVAVTVEQSGRVTIWWVGEDTPVATADAAAVQPRWLSERFAPTSASTVAADSSRIALRLSARADVPTRWSIIDTDVDSWIRRACDLAGRGLRAEEASALGLSDGRHACAR